MSFRRFVYFCALGGGWAGLLAWAVGRLVPGQHLVAQAGVKGMYLGLFVGLGLGLVDAFGNLSFRPFLRAGSQVSLALLVGAASGVIGGVIGQFLYGRSGLVAFLVLGWAVTGLLLGTAPGVFDLLACLVSGKSFRGALRKMQHGSLGGLAGGLLGGLLLVKMLWSVACRRATPTRCGPLARSASLCSAVASAWRLDWLRSFSRTPGCVSIRASALVAN